MTTYYFSASGKDSNSGTAAGQAWNSLSKLSSVTLHAGDQVLLERGSSFEQTLSLSKVSGTASNPITIGAYGVGADPVLDSPTGKGILAANDSHITIENITIRNTGDAGIYGTNANDFVLHNVTFDGAGGKNQFGSINWVNSTGITADHITVNNSVGDGLYMTKVTNVLVENSTFNTVTGHVADNIQISGTNVIIAGNTLSIDASSDTSKGNLVFQGSNFYAHDNTLQGANYGMSLSANNVVIENNTFKDHTESSWSSNISITDQITGDKMANIAIDNNDFYNANRSITIDGMNTTAAHMAVTGLEITGNDFHDFVRAPLLLNGADVTGTYADNTFNQATNTGIVNTNSSNTTNLYQSDNSYAAAMHTEALVAPAPAAAAPASHTVTITASGDAYLGAPLMELFQNGVMVGSQEIDASHASGAKQTVSFDISNIGVNDVFAVEFVNDKHGTKATDDRNLYVYGMSIDGTAAHLTDADLSAKVVLTKDKSDLFFSSNATATFTTSDFHGLNISNILESPHANLAVGGSPAASPAVAAAPMVYPASSDTLAHALDSLHQTLAAHAAS